VGGAWRWLEGERLACRLSVPVARAIVVAPVLIVAVAVAMWSTQASRPLIHWLLAENHPVETLTFFALLAAAVLGAGLALRARQAARGRLVTGFYAVFAAGLLFVAMEEISWGQWILGFEVPAGIRAVNKQGEFNLHNLPVLHAPFEILRMVFGLGGLLGVWLSSARLTRDIGAPAMLSSWFVLIAMLGALDLRNYFVPHGGQLLFVYGARLVEVLELMIGLSAWLYMWLNRRRFLRAWDAHNG